MTKYKAVKTLVDGIVFASKKEAFRYKELKILEKANLIFKLELQPKHPIIINGIKVCTYIGDFGYRDKKGRFVCEDVKGFKTAIYRLKKKLVKAHLDIDIIEV